MNAVRLLAGFIICIFGLVHVIRAAVFPARISLYEFAYTFNKFINVTDEDSDDVLLVKDITEDDKVWVNYQLLAPSWEYIPSADDYDDYDDYDFYDDKIIVLKADHLTLCDDMSQTKHRQIFEIIDSLVGLNVMEGCPIKARTIETASQFFMNFNYYEAWGNPTCADQDYLTIWFYSSESSDPIFEIDARVSDSRWKDFECLYDMDEG